MEINGISLDPYASPELTNYIGEQSNENRGNVASNYLQGTQTTKGLLDQPVAQNSLDKSLSYGDQATGAAIRSRYSQPYNRSMNELKTDYLKYADADHLKNLQASASLANTEVEQNRQKEMLKYQIEQANKRARGAIVGTVLGIVGGGVGLLVTQGNPAGGMAGYSAGQGLGNLYGSAN